MLTITNLQVFYDRAVEALRDVSLQVHQGQIVALLGSNGAGKSTVLKSICGVLYPEDGEIMGGSISHDGASLVQFTPHEIVRRGIVQVPEGRRLFDTLTVEENLRMGGYARPASETADALEQVFALFPAVKTHRHRVAGYLSGGQQQMVAIGRALMANPSMVLLDEPSMGLAPQIVEEVFNIVKDLNQKEHVTFLLAEQNTHMALRYADFGYIMESGRIVMDGAANDLANNEDVKEFYLGMGGGERKSFKDVKSYKRRKRWLA
jgi:branched-chain amino acid transport system ATP-binding protein